MRTGVCDMRADCQSGESDAHSVGTFNVLVVLILVTICSLRWGHAFFWQFLSAKCPPTITRNLRPVTQRRTREDKARAGSVAES
jgi:hypothetical protein